jgi:arylsulfatase A-like enzyme
MAGRDERLAAWPRDPKTIVSQLCEYYGMVTHLDSQIGRILGALEQSGQADNTIIVYAADHGLALGSHGLLGKQNLYEHSQLCPLIFVGPGIPENRSSEALTYLLDIFPTVLSLAGLDPVQGIDGKDLSPIWLGEKERVRDSIFLAYADEIRAVRDDRYKLIRYPQLNHTQLFDLRTDSGELNNLASNPAQVERIETLLDLLRNWQDRLGDTLPLTTDHPRALEIDLSGQKREPDRWQPSWIVEKYFQ